VIAQQIGKPLIQIPEEKIQEILALKRRAGLPDARMGQLPEPPKAGPVNNAELDRLVEQVVERLEGRV
jgi:hypothetical protein